MKGLGWGEAKGQVGATRKGLEAGSGRGTCWHIGVCEGWGRVRVISVVGLGQGAKIRFIWEIGRAHV